MEGIRAQQKDGWQEDVDRLSGQVEKDQATILAQLSRRVFIRAWYVIREMLRVLLILRSMWHELRVVLHNRENTLLTVLVQAFSKEEQEFSQTVFNNWVSLCEGVEGMPSE